MCYNQLMPTNKTISKSKALPLTVMIAIVLALVVAYSLAKCHYSNISGGHCHELLDTPHIHPFANH